MGGRMPGGMPGGMLGGRMPFGGFGGGGRGPPLRPMRSLKDKEAYLQDFYKRGPIRQTAFADLKPAYFDADEDQKSAVEVARRHWEEDLKGDASELWRRRSHFPVEQLSEWDRQRFANELLAETDVGAVLGESTLEGASGHVLDNQGRLVFQGRDPSATSGGLPMTMRRFLQPLGEPELQTVTAPAEKQQWAGVLGELDVAHATALPVQLVGVLGEQLLEAPPTAGSQQLSTEEAVERGCLEHLPKLIQDKQRQHAGEIISWPGGVEMRAAPPQEPPGTYATLNPHVEVLAGLRATSQQDIAKIQQLATAQFSPEMLNGAANRQQAPKTSNAELGDIGLGTDVDFGKFGGGSSELDYDGEDFFDDGLDDDDEEFDDSTDF
ncbi:hypothetical protein GNI_171070 [Gregarina niphandrodes]|uniref:Uncharacterized protein n=1 Tax=Gregarina niphandrodes TaxID=110365 RepID=A0A023AYW4_GRENI|nr:hypothetical protein GNI_171070 [Gregarina niphandrodes]EZG43465.1 hypothetical protein GNI_171070 [Gregarina niphandrodes]|eukprot:XP_011133316.1 hypothetical protein GNI_171070 [Gregarina niphandrodes]